MLKSSKIVCEVFILGTFRKIVLSEQWYLVNIIKLVAGPFWKALICCEHDQICAPGLGVIFLMLSTDSYSTAFMVLVLYSCLVEIISIKLFLTLLHAYARL
jgi:hypothetical protein